MGDLRGPKAVLRGNFIEIQANLKKIETFQTNSLTLHLQELEGKKRKDCSEQVEGRK